jgi:hypothetical protein
MDNEIGFLHERTQEGLRLFPQVEVFEGTAAQTDQFQAQTVSAGLTVLSEEPLPFHGFYDEVGGAFG